MKFNRTSVMAGVGAAGLLGAGLYIAAPAIADPSPSPSPSTTAKQHQGKNGQQHRKPRRARGFRGLHGEATVKRKDGFHVVTWQRGRVTGRSGAAVTVRSADGTSWQWTTDAGSRVRRHGEKAAVSAVADGARVAVFGERTGGTRTVKIIRIPKK